MQAGTTAGGTASASLNNCFVVNSPQQLFNCKVDVPLQNRVKFSASYILPGDVQIATVVQSNPGANYNANVTYTNAQIAPSLGRPLSGGAASVTLNVAPPNSLFGDRVNQMDFRAGKIFRFGGKRLQANFDLYNMFNASPVVNSTAPTGRSDLRRRAASYSQPTQILDGRLAKFSVQFDF